MMARYEYKPYWTGFIIPDFVEVIYLPEAFG
jgi:hypothetical protein